MNTDKLDTLEIYRAIRAGRLSFQGALEFYRVHAVPKRRAVWWQYKGAAAHAVSVLRRDRPHAPYLAPWRALAGLWGHYRLRRRFRALRP